MKTKKGQPKGFAEGYTEGWLSIMGTGAALPSIPSYAIPAGKTAYQHGYELGRTAAEKRKSPC
jgi:hypothetical protein